jgi:hypothetical protein
MLRNCSKNGPPPNPLPQFLHSILGRTTCRKVKKYRTILDGLITGAVNDHYLAASLIDDNLFVKYIKLNKRGGLCNYAIVL